MTMTRPRLRLAERTHSHPPRRSPIRSPPHTLPTVPHRDPCSLYNRCAEKFPKMYAPFECEADDTDYADSADTDCAGWVVACADDFGEAECEHEATPRRSTAIPPAAPIFICTPTLVPLGPSDPSSCTSIIAPLHPRHGTAATTHSCTPSPTRSAPTSTTPRPPGARPPSSTPRALPPRCSPDTTPNSPSGAARREPWSGTAPRRRRASYNHSNHTSPRRSSERALAHMIQPPSCHTYGTHSLAPHARTTRILWQRQKITLYSKAWIDEVRASCGTSCSSACVDTSSVSSEASCVVCDARQRRNRRLLFGSLPCCA